MIRLQQYRRRQKNCVQIAESAKITNKLLCNRPMPKVQKLFEPKKIVCRLQKLQKLKITNKLPCNRPIAKSAKIVQIPKATGRTITAFFIAKNSFFIAT